MIQVDIPASVPLKEFDYSAGMELINSVASTVATATFREVDIGWYVKADDLILRGQTRPHQKYKKEAPESEKQVLLMTNAPLILKEIPKDEAISFTR